MNWRMLAIGTISLGVISGRVFADSGVIIESSGDVRLRLPTGESQVASKGKKYPDGTTMVTGKDGRVVVVTEFGQMFRIGPNTTVQVGERSGDTAMVSVSQGLILAFREGMGGPQGGPRAHGAVKGLGGNAVDAKMNKRTLSKELKEVDLLPLESGEARDLIRGQIYYRYGEYQKAVELLEPIYRSDRKAAYVKELLASSYEKMGQDNEAARYR